MRPSTRPTDRVASFLLCGFLAFVGCFFMADPVLGRANDLPAVQKLFDEGDFAKAAEAGKLLDTSAGWAVSARALLIEAAYLAPAPEKEARLLEAEAAARKALAKDQNNTNAMIQLVIALGYRVRIEGTLKAQTEGRAGETKALLERALALEPQNAWANAAFGGWNGQIVRSAGSLLGKLLFGATLDLARAGFAKAMSLDPGNVSILVEYGKLLLNLKPGSYTREAKPLLVEALTHPPKNAFEKILLGQAQALVEAINSGDEQRLKETLKAATPFSK
jgi:tetratricopeptide (TPR) repeat protein